MRFDNPIYDHGFVFPDIADFPDILHEKDIQVMAMRNMFCNERRYTKMIYIHLKEVINGI